MRLQKAIKATILLSITTLIVGYVDASECKLTVEMDGKRAFLGTVSLSKKVVEAIKTQCEVKEIKMSDEKRIANFKAKLAKKALRDEE